VPIGRHAVALAAFAAAVAAGPPGFAATQAKTAQEQLTASEKQLAESRAEQEKLQQQQQALAAELESLRKEAVVTAATAQQHEQAIAALAAELAPLNREQARKQRLLSDNRAQQGRLLLALERIARDPPEALVVAPEAPIDQIRSGLLISAAMPVLDAQAHALKDELDSIAALQADIRAKRADLVAHRHALDGNRRLLAEMVARRLDLQRQAVSDEAEVAAKTARLSEQTADLHDLISRLDAESEQRDKERLAHAAKGLPHNLAKGKVAEPPAASSDPTRPRALKIYDGARAAMLLPVSGHITRRWAEADESGVASKGLSFAAVGGAEIVAPFDGRVEFAGPFRGYGLILIIQHGGGYHSLLTGLGRVDAEPGQWVLAGEPVGAVAETADENAGSSAALYFELRHNGQPIDPQPLLAKRDGRSGRGDRSGDK